MSKDELDFEFTVKDLDQMVLDAARGDEGQEKGAKITKKPNLLEVMRTGGQLEKLKTRNEG